MFGLLKCLAIFLQGFLECMGLSNTMYKPVSCASHVPVMCYRGTAPIPKTRKNKTQSILYSPHLSTDGRPSLFTTSKPLHSQEEARLLEKKSSNLPSLRSNENSSDLKRSNIDAASVSVDLPKTALPLSSPDLHHPISQTSRHVQTTATSLDGLHKSLEDLKKRRRESMKSKRGLKSEVVSSRPPHSGSGERELQRRTQTESFVLRPGTGQANQPGQPFLPQSPVSEWSSPCSLPSSSSSRSRTSESEPLGVQKYQVTDHNCIWEDEEKVITEQGNGGTKSLLSSESLAQNERSTGSSPSFPDSLVDISSKPLTARPLPPPRHNCRPYTMTHNNKHSSAKCSRSFDEDLNSGSQSRTSFKDYPRTLNLGGQGDIRGQQHSNCSTLPSEKQMGKISPMLQAPPGGYEGDKRRLQSKGQQEMDGREGEGERGQQMSTQSGGMGVERRGSGKAKGGRDSEWKKQRRRDVSNKVKQNSNQLKEKEQERERKFCESQKSKESEVEVLPGNIANLTSLSSFPSARKVSEQRSRMPQSLYEKENEMSMRMATLKKEGQQLLNCFKVCC